ncbi:MAG: response regulator transcription factor [Planctomycetota bacterium]
MTDVPLIVVVDDEATIRDSIDMFLCSLGYRVEGFESAEAFLNAIPDDPWVCLLIDVRMPGMNGIELVKQLQQREYAATFVLMSGDGEDVATEFAEAQTPPLTVLAKPFSAERLQEFVVQLGHG